MRFDYPQAYEIISPGAKTDVYTVGSNETIPDWDNAVTRTLYGFVTHTSSVQGSDLNRSELSETATLTFDSPVADIRRGDRVREPDGRLWEVNSVPVSETNPFTGWNPVTWVGLRRWEG